jgi:acetate kinase
VDILIVNAGSSSLKLRVLDPADTVVASADLPGSLDGLDEALAGFGHVDAVGHRVVHGGLRYSAAVRVDGQVRRDLEALTDLAPLHQPPALHALDEVTARLPGVPQVACFDTAFHTTIPPAVATFALPADWREKWPLRRYGFHGLSHAYIARRMVALCPDASRVVSCHLGAGASLCAIRDGRSVDTTMGFTPLDGLVMATRSGSVDPGLLLWLGTHAHLPLDEMNDALEHRSGLTGLAGTPDMRAVLASAAAGDPDAILARDVYLHRLTGLIASMAAALGGLDALVFTGGVGENSAEIRTRAMDGLGFLGVRGYDSGAGSGDRQIGDRAYVITAREDIEIAGQVRATVLTAEQIAADCNALHQPPSRRAPAAVSDPMSNQ